MKQKIRVGVVGAGIIVSGLHIPSINSHPLAVVSAICSRTREHAGSVAKKYSIPEVYTDYRVMIKEANLDAIVIATPDDLHYPMTMVALDAGLHVLCEKPLALTVSEAGEMAEKACVTGLKNMIFCTNRWRPHCRFLKELLDQEFIGIPYHIHLSFLGGYGRQPVYKWRFDANRANGILGDLGSHLIDLARWYIGDIVKVSAILGSFVKRPGSHGEEHNPANDSAMLLLEFATGTQGLIQTSAVAYTADRHIEHHIIVHGSEGTLEVDHTMEGTNWSKNILKTAISVRGTRQKMDHFDEIIIPERLWENADPSNSWSVFNGQSAGPRLFIDAIVEDRDVVPNFNDGLKVQQVIEAAIQSHEQGRWISLTNQTNNIT